MRTTHGKRPSRGQAMLEGLVGLGALATLFIAVPVVGRYVDVGIVTTQDSAHAAFLTTRDAFPDAALAQAVALHAPALPWRDPAGRALVGAPMAVAQSRTPLAQAAQAGGAAASVLRQGWQIEDAGIRVVQAARRARDVTGAATDTLRFSRATAVLAEAGHGVSPAEVQRRVSANPRAWLDARQQSHAVAAAVGRQIRRVDAGWRRPAITEDWVQDWADLVPRDQLTREAP